MIRFAKVSSFYPEGIAKMYADDPSLKYASYAMQYRTMMDQGIGWADSWVINLNKTKNFTAELFIINNEFAQKKWASEHQLKYSEDNWMEEILLAQFSLFQPEIFFANDYVYLNPGMIRKLREQIQSIHYVLGWDGVGLCDENRFTECDIIVSCGSQITDYYNSKGKKCLLFQFGFESTLLDKLQKRPPQYNISFAGSLTLRNGGHHDRLKLLGKVASYFDVDFWLSSFAESKPYLLKNILKKGIHNEWSDVKDILKLWSINKGSVFGLGMYQVLADSAITLNSHIDTSFHAAGNIRLWEATGVGACLVTDWKPNMEGLFKPDEEVVLYKSPEECIEKINFLIHNPDKRKAIAAAGQKRTIEEYSYEKRIKDFIPVLESLLG